MSPEQLAGESQLVDHRTDIYALGVVLFETLTGRLPYKARTPQALREQILFRPPSPLRETLPDVSAALESICYRCLAKHPSDRYSTSGELAQSLRGTKAISRSSFNWTFLGLTTLGIAFLSQLFFSVMSWLPASEGAFVAGGVMNFDGRTRVVTNLERTLPVTVEAWVKPDQYKDENCQFIIGSDIPGKYGCGIGVCGSVLTVEYVGGTVISEASVVPEEWSHIAAVFSESETRLYLNGKLVIAAPGSSNDDNPNFVIGNVGETNYLCYYRGQIRSSRISEGERYAETFEPSDLSRDQTTLLLLNETASVSDESILDQDAKMVGIVERL